ncbi:glycosyltransferase [Leifsonia sp. H3M29-4]|nr:glycosyltransferase [Salinibacterium metalliresistens]MDF1480102.1 glycosyltransferase [Salinibacterium metalliresistens]
MLLACDTFWPEINGSANFVARLAAGLVERGHDVHVAAPAYTNKKVGAFQEEHEGQTMTVHRIYSWRWYPHPWLRFSLPWRIKQNSARILDAVKPDVVHFQSHIVIGRGMTLEGMKRGVRLIGTNHFMPENLLEYTAILPKRLKPWAVQLAWDAADRSFSRAERVTAPTEKAAEYLAANTSVKDVLAISCGIDAHNYTPDFTPKSENLIVFLGRMAEEKQVDKLLRAFAKLDPALNAKLELMGGGDQEKPWRALAASLGLGDRVHFASYVEDDYLRSTLTRAKVFAMPSIAELQSISTMEAMASGLPIVGANAMALPHLVHDGENGFLFEPGNVDELAEKLTAVLTMPHEEMVKMQKESLRIVEAHDIQRTLDTFESLYRGEPVSVGVGTAAKAKNA